MYCIIYTFIKSIYYVENETIIGENSKEYSIAVINT